MFKVNVDQFQYPKSMHIIFTIHVQNRKLVLDLLHYTEDIKYYKVNIQNGRCDNLLVIRNKQMNCVHSELTNSFKIKNVSACFQTKKYIICWLLLWTLASEAISVSLMEILIAIMLSPPRVLDLLMYL